MNLHASLFVLPLLLAFASVEPFFFKLPFLDSIFTDPYNYSPQPANPAPEDNPSPALDDEPTGFGGKWDLVSENAGVSAMHIIVTPANKAIMFDTFVYGPSQIPLPNGNCRRDTVKNVEDCWAHAVEYDLATNGVRPLKLFTDSWCSSGGLAPDGTLVSSGGWFDGGRSVRYLSTCDTCDWQEYPEALYHGSQRWYATQQLLPDGQFVVVGGRRAFSYEYVPPPGRTTTRVFPLPFLRKTTDVSENNLYPFVHLLPDGNLFVFANHRAILLNPVRGKIVKRYPNLNGGSRNYPASGMSALLPLDLRGGDGDTPAAVEIVVCGGAPPEGMANAANGTFLPALKSCGRIDVGGDAPRWAVEEMPVERVMGDMLVLPNTDVLLINGARRGVSGWWFAREPVFAPVLYKPNSAPGQRFTTLAKSNIARVYHSSAVVLPEGAVLVAGSNTNNGYNFTGVLFPTEVRVEKFYPPYTDTRLFAFRPKVDPAAAAATVGYGDNLDIDFGMTSQLDRESVMVTMYAPTFTTHGFSQGQRMLILKTTGIADAGDGMFQVTAVMPTSRALAPPGYYMVFVVHREVPSVGFWVKIQ